MKGGNYEANLSGYKCSVEVGFHELLNYVEPGYCIVSIGTITSHVIKCHKENKDEQKAQLL